MSDVTRSLEKLVQSASLLIVGTIFGKFLSFLAETFIARSISPENYGSLALVYTITLIASQVALFGIHNGATRLISAEKSWSSQRQILQHSYLLVLISSTSAIIVLIAGRNIFSHLWTDTRISGLIVLFLPLVLLNPLKSVTLGALRSAKKSKIAVLSRDIIGKTTAVIGLCGAAYLADPKVGAILYWVWTPLLIIILIAYFVRDEIELVDVIIDTPSRTTFRQIWGFSWPLAASTFIFVFLTYTDILMIGYFLDSTSVGYYRALQPLRNTAIFFTGTFSFLYLPLVTEHFENGEIYEIEKLYTSSTKWMTIATFPIILVLGLFSEPVVRLILGSVYIPAASALSILVIGLFFRTVVGLNGDTVKAINKPKIEFISAIAGLMTNFTLNLILVPRYGIDGAAASTVIGYLVYNVIETASIYISIGIHPFTVNSIKPLFPTLIIGLSLSSMASNHLMSGSAVVGISVFLVMAQLISVIFTRSLDSSDIELIEMLEDFTGADLSYLKLIGTK